MEEISGGHGRRGGVPRQVLHRLADVGRHARRGPAIEGGGAWRSGSDDAGDGGSRGNNKTEISRDQRACPVVSARTSRLSPSRSRRDRLLYRDAWLRRPSVDRARRALRGLGSRGVFIRTLLTRFFVPNSETCRPRPESDETTLPDARGACVPPVRVASSGHETTAVGRYGIGTRPAASGGHEVQVRRMPGVRRAGLEARHQPARRDMPRFFPRPRGRRRTRVAGGTVFAGSEGSWVIGRAREPRS